jgi:uncharacterized YccA/Bax inhibitor family protein
MQSSNPVFSRSEGFNGRGRASGVSYPAYGTPPAQGYGQGYQDPYGQGGAPARVDQGRMTIDSVVQKTGITLGIVVLVAGATWFLTGPVDSPEAVGTLYTLSITGALVGFALAMVNSFKRVVSPALVLAYAAVEGIFVGAFSKSMEAMFGDGLVMGAVIGTFAAVAGTLAAYKFFEIKVGQKFRTFVIAAVFGMVGLSLVEMVLGMFSSQLGLFGFGALGLLFAVAGLVLGVFMLILDFDFVEQGVAAGIDERESWRAAFAMTVSLVWIYTNLLRILAILQQD